MKKTAIVVDFSERSARRYCEQLRSLFLDAVELRACSTSELLPGAELALFTSHEAYARSTFADTVPPNLVFAERTVTREGFDALIAALGPSPSGPIALLDECREMADRMAATLRSLGFHPGSLSATCSGDALGGLTVLTLGEAGEAGLCAERLVDLGEPYLDVCTIIDVGIRLDLDPLFHRHCIRNSYRELMTANLGLADILGKMNSCEGSLDVILRSVDAGVLSVDAEGRVSSCNVQAASLLGLDLEVIKGAAASKVLPRVPFQGVLQSKQPLVDRLVSIGRREIGYSIDPILHSGQLYGAVAVFSEKAAEPASGAGRGCKLDASQLGRGYRARYTFDDLVAESEAMRKCRDIARRTADSGSSVLIYGESGTGKEVFAQAMHNASRRRSHPFVAINCGALPESLLESELFGYEEGAFTGARKGGKPGLFELAHHGTLFLDEMASMPISLQMRILRVLEEREVMRLGSDRIIGVDIRVIAATNRDLRRLVAEGSFREDLYYRLSVLPLSIPPLREHREDVLPLLRRFQRLFDFDFELEAEAERFLLSYDWPGNARELRNYVEYLANLGLARVSLADLPARAEPQPRSRSASTSIGAAGLAACQDAPDDAEGRRRRGEEAEAEKRRFVLEELDAAYSRQMRLGRRSLYSAARARRLYISEQEIRAILKSLEAESLVAIKPGKGGTLITELGREALVAMK